jgi:uncharacterized protein
MPDAGRQERTATAFLGTERLASGPLPEVARAVTTQFARDPSSALLVFDDTTGEQIDLNLRRTLAGDLDGLEQRSALRPPLGDPEPESVTPRGRGRPRLGVVAREVTLLPRHWAWLETQPGGASAALRRLVEDATRDAVSTDERRARHEASYRFIHAIAGDAEGFEEASRALFADDAIRFHAAICTWPPDIRTYALMLASFSDSPISSPETPCLDHQ